MTTTFCFKDAAATLHQVQRRPAAVRVDGVDVRVLPVAPHTFVAQAGSRHQRVHAVAHGDTVHVHMNGRAWQLERPDPARGGPGAAGQGSGGARAPMPGVVVSWLVQPGSAVRDGDALLVIESMKLQMTITAHLDGILEDLPFAEGQTFHRGALLARIRDPGDSQ